MTAALPSGSLLLMWPSRLALDLMATGLALGRPRWRGPPSGRPRGGGFGGQNSEGEKGLEIDFEGEVVGSLPGWIWKSKCVLGEGISQRVGRCVFLGKVKKFTGRRPGLLPSCVNFCCRPCVFPGIWFPFPNLSLNSNHTELPAVFKNYQFLKTICSSGSYP